VKYVAGALLVAAIILVVACVVMLSRRNERDLERIWQRLLSPRAAWFRDGLEEQIQGEREVLAATSEWVSAARRAGDLEQARRLEEVASAEERGACWPRVCLA
jgi:sensor domain CHASE-containing protein